MIRTLRVEIKAGERTCFSAPGEPCPRMVVARMGTRWLCGLFRGVDGREIELFDESGGQSGWLQRCAPCLAADVTP